jgi:hypothetical protein
MRGRGKGKQQAVAQQAPAPVQQVTLSLPPADISLAGPTDFCNWVIEERLLMGAYPKRTSLLSELLKAGLFGVCATTTKSGITTFVSLVHQRELDRLETYGPYFATAQKLVTENPTEFLQKPSELQFVHLPISGLFYPLFFSNKFKIRMWRVMKRRFNLWKISSVVSSKEKRFLFTVGEDTAGREQLWRFCLGSYLS